MDVRLHIDRLVLDGFNMTPSERIQFVDAAQLELGRLLQQHGLATEGFSTPATSGGIIGSMTGHFDPVSYGNQVAMAVYRSLGGPSE